MAVTEGNRQVGFGEAISLFFKNYANFQGRSSRGAFWWWFLASFIIGFVLGFVDGMIMAGQYSSSGQMMPIGILGGLFSLATLIPNLALGIRRLHDTDKSGWWILIGLIPLIGFIVLIVFYVMPGTRGDNKFGPDVEAGRA
jgi:uncharacterized membrane protein YhaH (DUF805 family)